jgi:hypothetical protein
LAPRASVLVFLEAHHARAFAHHKAVAVLVIGAAGRFGAVVEAAVERARLRETGNADRADGRFGAARQHHVGIAIADHARGIADGMRARGAGGDHAWSVSPYLIETWPEIRLIRRPCTSGATRGSGPFRPAPAIALDARQAANAAADRAAHAQAQFLGRIFQACILDRLAGRIDAEHDEGIDLALNLVIHRLPASKPYSWSAGFTSQAMWHFARWCRTW